MGRRRKKNFIVPKVTFTGIADKGKSVGRDEEGRVIFAENTAPGDVADILVTRKKKGFLMGKAQTYHQLSEDRVQPFCQHYGPCGGCKWQHLSYDAQLKHKEKVVRDAMQRIARVEIGDFQPILGAPETTFYRNKLEFSFSNKRWLAPEELNTEVSNKQDVLGFHPQGAFDKIIDIEKCWLQPDPSNAIRNGIRDLARKQALSFWDARANEGFLRNMMLRITTLDQTLLLIAFSTDEQNARERFLDAILEQHPQITSLYYCINTKVNDFMMDLPMHLYYGPGRVEEKLGTVRFRIGPKSFFQTNTRQGQQLYDVVTEFAELTGQENVYDLYTGLGSIALYLAGNCKNIVGIEEIEAAIEDARINAEQNDIRNASFYAGDVKDILTKDFAAAHGAPDLLVTDPPRAGMHPKVVDMLLELEPPRLVYVSCNPATQARDLQLLSSKYRVERMRPVDMFPHTHHIENVALLKRIP